MWVLLDRGDTAIVPSPSYPIHIYAPLFAGAEVQRVRLGPGEDFFANMLEAFENQWPKPRVIIISFPHNPTTTCVDLDWMQRIVDFAREHDVVLVHDFAYSDTVVRRLPAAVRPAGARREGRRRRALHDDEVVLDGRLARRVPRRQRRRSAQALAKLKSYLDYGTFQPIQIAATVTMNDAPDYPKEVNEIYQGRRDALCDGLARIGWDIEKPKGTMFVWAPIPDAYADMGSLEFAKFLVQEAEVAVSPGVGFGPGRRGLRPVRPDREREADRTGRPEPPQGAHEALGPRP